jgi:hypothetical protein
MNENSIEHQPQQQQEPFDLTQRNIAPKKSCSVWAYRQLAFLVLKIGFFFAFYAIQFRSHQITRPPLNPALHAQLAEFRAASRTSLHEHTLLQTRRLGTSNVTDPNLLTRPYEWKPLGSQCLASEMLDPFPESFDEVFYRAAHAEDREHYITSGRENGWNCSRGQYMRNIINEEIALALPGKILEVGPFINPMVRNVANGTGKVQYFDVADWNTLQTMALQEGYTPSPDPVEITYVASSGDLSVIGANLAEDAKPKFSMVVSSNVIGVQRDLVRHLQQVNALLEEGGYYTMAVPDIRFSFDHFVTETTIGDILEDYYTNRDGTVSAGLGRTPKIKSLVEKYALNVANSPEKNWHGEYRFPFEDANDKAFLDNIKKAISEFKAAKTGYFDVPRYHFTPSSLSFAMDTLYTLQLSDLRVHRLYYTLANADEFYIVLKKCTRVQPEVIPQAQPEAIPQTQR